ncbi:hypothetical protein [uncultured Ruegeria sp.]|jgi:hypothetical protein|uniref:hypothetical protein n=1 Tax=uncultured Ruegeria sp. TaxID=259304 RepID=UPI002618BBF8|nr:hypothetical protein [uncultured Ruegeria sp.]
MTPETLALIATYLMCSEAAEIRVLDRSEVKNCTSIYMQVKLSFVPDFHIEDYRRATATERAALNQQGYASFLAWRVSNPDLVKEMEADARISAIGQDN